MTHANMRAVKGVLGEKLGMTQVWDADSRLIPVTVIQAGPCVVTQVRGADTVNWTDARGVARSLAIATIITDYTP